MAGPEKHEFKSEARQLLDLMIHSLYSHKEIFLRELVSNASDALDKLRFEALSNADLLPAGTELGVTLSTDADARTLTVSDNGIGMSRAECIAHLGTIARSGTREFTARLNEARTQGVEGAERLIGQFGVGFYASFMAAEQVTVVTRRAGEATATRWVSTGDGTYTVEDAERETQGTSVTLTLRPADPENGLEDFTDEWTIRRTIKKYSDFVTFPIKHGDKTLNSMKAIWTRPQSEVSAEEYAEFYKHISHDWEPPFETLTLKAEAPFEYKALLFVPSRPPFDLWQREQKFGLQLYVNRVLIMESCDELVPSWLRFVKGVVDSPDLSLNVSREILQHDRRVAQIRKKIVRKVIDFLERLFNDERERFTTLWGHFGRLLKEGAALDEDNRERLQGLLWFHSTADAEKPTTFADYIARMKPEQEDIYYIAGESRATLEKSPHLEAFRAKGYEVLLFDDTIDEFLVDRLREVNGKKLRSIAQGDVELGTEEERSAAEETRKAREEKEADFLARIGSALEADVREVRVSARLTESPACLVGDEHDMSPHLERLLRQAQPGSVPEARKRVLEINPDHPVLQKMRARFEADASDPRIDTDARLLHGQALLAEGSPLPDPAAFGRLVAGLMAT